MQQFPSVLGSQRNYVTSFRANTTLSTIAATGGSGHVWGSPTSLIASTPFDSTGIMLRLGSATAASATRTDFLFEVMIGAGGSEQTLIGPLLIGGKPAGTIFSLPILIPAGSRISVRIKGAVASKSMPCVLDLFGAPGRDLDALPSAWVSYGVVNDASNSHGTLVTAGSANAWGSWTTLSTNTTYAHDLWLPMIDMGTASTTVALTYRSQFALMSAADAATAATNGTVWEGPLWATTTAEIQNNSMVTAAGAWMQGDTHHVGGLIAQSLPAGSTVCGRAMCSGTPDANALGMSILAAVA